MKFLIATYTHKLKEYCDKQFLDSLYNLSQGNEVLVLDTTPGTEYKNKLDNYIKENNYSNFKTESITVPIELTGIHRFKRCVSMSTNYIREYFLAGDYDYVLFIESDVICEPDTLDKFKQAILKISTLDPKWGILGGLYYKYIHDFANVFNDKVAYGTHLRRTHHVMSGLTIYRRKLLQQFKFKYDLDTGYHFSDTWICQEAEKDFTFYYDDFIIADHHKGEETLIHFWDKIDGWNLKFEVYDVALKTAINGMHFVEVGVYKGRSAAYLAVELNNRKLKIKFDAIDHFKCSAEHIFDPHLYEKCKRNLIYVKNIVNIIKKDSILAANDYEDNSLDLVYIDASHDYKAVKNDIDTWLPKVKKGGIIGGDDYMDNWPEVKKAVNERFPTVNTNHYQWWTIK